MVSIESDTSLPDVDAHRRSTTGIIDTRLPTGTIIDDRYCIDALLGEGGMGAVYSAEHVKVGRLVAFKVLALRWCDSDDIVRRFRDEARAASAAGHPNIVEVFDAGDLPDGRPYIVMEHLEGRELADIIDRLGPLEPARACRVVRDVARALDAAHARGVIHRDLKGENVMLVERGGEEIVKVLDFGIASNNTLSGPRTVPGLVMGTPATMAPEQVKGKPPTIAFDVYALGVLLHFALSGRMPFDDREGLAVLVAKTSERAPSIATLCEGLPQTLVELVDSCLAIDPAMRPATAREVADRLAEVLEALRPGTARPAVAASTPQPVTDPARPSVTGVTPTRRRMVVPVVLVALASLGAVALVLREPTSDESASSSGKRKAPELAPEPDSRPEAAPPSPELAAAKIEPIPPLASSTAGSTDVRAEPVPSTNEALPRDPKVDALPVVGDREPPAADVKKGPSVASDASAASAELCWRTRKQAEQARGDQNWEGVLRHTRNPSCWTEQREPRRRLRAMAYMELGQWSACVEASRGLDDAEGLKWQKLCRLRKEQE
jgi:serine/threonine protein kinase